MYNCEFAMYNCEFAMYNCELAMYNCEFAMYNCEFAIIHTCRSHTCVWGTKNYVEIWMLKSQSVLNYTKKKNINI